LREEKIRRDGWDKSGVYRHRSASSALEKNKSRQSANKAKWFQSFQRLKLAFWQFAIH
jgi:hypothetical protein